MRKILIAMALMVGSFGALQAQMSGAEVDLMKSILKSEVKVFFAQNMKLKTQETEQFWQIYDAYEEELKPATRGRIALLKKIMERQDDLAETEVDEMIKQAMKLQMERRKLRAKYYKLYKKKMGISIAAQFYQLDQYINTLVTATMNEGMPFVVPK